MTNDTELTFKEYLACQELTFEWAESYDSKDWTRLASILAPTIKVNYASVNDFKDEALPASSFVAMMSDPKFLGDPLIDTQHLMGGSKYRKLSSTHIEAQHQIRAAHQRYKTLEKKEVEVKGHGYAMITLTYRQVEGVWKWGGITTLIRWNEHDFDKVFKFHPHEEQAVAALVDPKEIAAEV
ncbi:hypothetical protein MMC26_003052 [Xylographa opegraphella]|nr:hypothetical protein [Xylographa opegraphella]